MNSATKQVARHRALQRASLFFLLLAIVATGACGGGGSSAGSGGTGGTGGSGGGTGGGGTGGNSTPPRPFNGDFAVRLPEQNGYSTLSSLVYDPALKEIFVSNTYMNSVDVYSTVDGHFVGGINVPGPAGLSLAPDNSKLVIGTITSYIYTADPSALHITRRVAIPAADISADQSGNTLLPLQPFAMADGTIFVGMGTDQTIGSTSLSAENLLLYDPSNGSFTSDDPGSGGGTGAAVRSLDGTALAVSAIVNDNSGFYLYTTASKSYTVSATIPSSAAVLPNANASQFAVVQSANPGVITFLNASLQPQNSLTLQNTISGNPVFSRDGSTLYVSYQNGVEIAINAQTASVTGYLGATVTTLVSIAPAYLDIDENNHLFALDNGSVVALNASQLQPNPPAGLLSFSVLGGEGQPLEGPVGVGTPVVFFSTSVGSDNGIEASEQAYFGSTPATQNVIAPYEGSTLNGLTSTSPASTSPGPVAVVLTDSSGNAGFLPDAFTFGPTILRVQPTGVGPQGGDQITVTGYGFGYVTPPQVTINGTAVPSKLNSYASFYYPEQSLTFIVPPGKPGWADIAVTTPDGASTKLSRGVQYLQTETTLSGPPYTNAVYDATRNCFYLTGGDTNVAVFDVATQAFLAPLTSTKISAGATLSGVALTADDSNLIVVDSTDQALIVFDLDANTSTSISTALPSDTPYVVPGFVQVAANNTAFVEMQSCATDQIREVDLANGSVRGRTEGDTNCGPATGFPEFGEASSDGSVVLFSGTPSAEPTPPAAVWKYTSSGDSISGPSEIGDTSWLGGTPAVNSDGTLLTTGSGVLDQRLLPLVPLGTFALGGDSHLTDSGALLISADNLPSSINGGILVRDTHQGLQLLSMLIPPQSPSSKVHPMSTELGVYPWRPLAISAAGDKLLYASIFGGVSYYQLSVIPLAVGTVTPSTASTGSQVTVHGSGFVTGTTAKIGGQSASCTMSDAETLSCAVPNLPAGPVTVSLSNPDGQAYSYDYAFVVQ
jgi:IPT/TIG domain